MSYDMSSWFFELKNKFEKLDRLTSEQAYRRILDNIEEFMDSFQAGNSVHETYEDYWN